MEIQSDEKLNIISKLMNEEVNPVPEKYKGIQELVEKELVKILDQGRYTDNATIIRNVNDLLEKSQIFNMIPELAGRSLFGIWGNSKKISKEFKAITKKRLGIEFNTNLPLLLVSQPKKIKNRVYAITYMNKLIELSYDEYLCVTRELYKENIDIRKLIKAFVINYYEEKSIQNFLILPEYIDEENSFFRNIINLVDVQIVIADQGEKWKKLVDRLLLQNVNLIGTESDYNYIKDRIESEIHLCDEKGLVQLCNDNDIQCINYSISIELENVLMDVSVFYNNEKQKLRERMEQLAKSLIELKSQNIKDQVANYRKETAKEQEKIEKSSNEYERIKEKIISAAYEYENSLSELLKNELADDVNADKYIKILLSTFNKHIYAEDYKSAYEDYKKLNKANYKYPNACKCLLKNKQGKELMESDIIKLKKYPDTEDEIAKIKIELSKELGLLTEALKKLVENVESIDTGKENYYYGKMLLDKKEYIQATKFFMKALEDHFDKAGVELVKLADKHPECDIDIEELAENLVAEANYYIGKENIGTNRKKAIVNLKIAASMKHREAIKLIADILFEKYKNMSWQNMQKEENIHTVNNIISLYYFLEKRPEDREKYELKIGLMLCKLENYSRAYDKLKNIECPEAQYECAKMCQYGKGMAKNLKKAKKHYEKTDKDYLDRDEQYKKVCNEIKKETEKKEQKSYNENRNYSSSRSSTYESSSYCFITTAACIALNDNKDCKELNELRDFRDKYIIGDGDDGDELVEEYYRIGPEIVKCIDSEWNPYAIYEELWSDYILPSCKKIKQEKYKEAKKIYINMVKSLCEKYGISVKDSIMKKYLIKLG